jgi:hypothetical protein
MSEDLWHLFEDGDGADGGGDNGVDGDGDSGGSHRVIVASVAGAIVESGGGIRGGVLGPRRAWEDDDLFGPEEEVTVTPLPLYHPCNTPVTPL